MRKINTKTTLETIAYLDSKLNYDKRVFFVRFGDGEVFDMMGRSRRNQVNSPELIKEMTEAFSIQHPNYIKAIAINMPNEKGMSEGVFANYSFNAELENAILKFSDNLSLDFYNPITFHYLSVFKPKLVYAFLEKHIRPKKKMFVGNTDKESAEKLYGKIDYYINVPPKSAYSTIDDWWPQIEKNCFNIELAIISAGAATKVVAKRLWNKNLDIQLFDFGSIIDAIDGKVSRTWIRLVGHRVNKILPKEFQEKSITKRFIFALKDIKYFFRRLIK